MLVLEILAGLVALAVVALVLAFAGWLIAHFICWFLPAIVGLAGSVALWIWVNDNVAVLFAIGMVVCQVWWQKRLESGMSHSPHWPTGKRAHYDQQGKVTGYEDR